MYNFCGISLVIVPMVLYYNCSIIILVRNKKHSTTQEDIEMTYGMMNVTIEKSNNNTYLVYADTERWGEHEIMFESYSREECITWLKANGWEEEEQTVEQVMENGVKRHGAFFKIQIAGSMYHRVHKEAGKWMGHSNRWGWEELDLTGFHMTGELTAVRTSWKGQKEWQKKQTLKIGKACTW